MNCYVDALILPDFEPRWNQVECEKAGFSRPFRVVLWLLYQPQLLSEIAERAGVQFVEGELASYASQGDSKAPCGPSGEATSERQGIRGLHGLL